MPSTVKPAFRWMVLDEDTPPERLRLSPVLPETVAESTLAPGALPAVLVRRQTPYVLLGPKDRRLPRIDAGVRWLESLGYPILIRLGGGSAVLLDEGCLSFAVTKPGRDLTTWQSNYQTLVEGVARGLAHLGVEARFGAAAGSYCEGPYDLVVGEPARKIAGIAQAIRRGFVLVSGMLLVSQDPVRTTGILQEFYERAGASIRLSADVVTSLEQYLSRPVSMSEVLSAVRVGFAEGFDLRPTPWDSATWQRAGELWSERQSDLDGLGSPSHRL